MVPTSKFRLFELILFVCFALRSYIENLKFVKWCPNINGHPDKGGPLRAYITIQRDEVSWRKKSNNNKIRKKTYAFTSKITRKNNTAHTQQNSRTLCNKRYTQRVEQRLKYEKRIIFFILRGILSVTLYFFLFFFTIFLFLLCSRRVCCVYVVLFCLVGAVCCPVSHKPFMHLRISDACSNFFYLRRVYGLCRSVLNMTIVVHTK